MTCLLTVQAFTSHQSHSVSKTLSNSLRKKKRSKNNLVYLPLPACNAHQATNCFSLERSPTLRFTTRLLRNSWTVVSQQFQLISATSINSPIVSLAQFSTQCSFRNINYRWFFLNKLLDNLLRKTGGMRNWSKPSWSKCIVWESMQRLQRCCHLQN